MDYICKSVGVNTTAALVLAAAEFDREVILSPLTDTVFAGFDSTNVARIQQAIYVGTNTVGRPTRFVLPAEKELWAVTNAGSAELNYIAAVAR